MKEFETRIETQVCYLYEQFYKAIYRKNYVFRPSLEATRHINAFKNMLQKHYAHETIGIHFLNQYFVFQFNYWTKLELRQKQNWHTNVSLTYIIGQKAFKRWIERDEEFDFTILLSDFLDQYKIDTNKFVRYFDTQHKVKVSQFEELEKKKYYNTNQGLMHCVLYTTLFNPFSPLCALCTNRADCKTILNNNFPNLAKERTL